MSDTSLTGRERTFDADDIIVSKTDTKGRLIYANDLFLELADYTEADVIGQPHSIIRHPDMPRCVFKLLWDHLQAGKEIFAYVVNRSKNGDHYWVLAHVTPTFDDKGTITGYHSSRRAPDLGALKKIKPLYTKLLEEEKRHANSKDGLAASTKMLTDLLDSLDLRYDQFIFKTISESA